MSEDEFAIAVKIASLPLDERQLALDQSGFRSQTASSISQEVLALLLGRSKAESASASAWYAVVIRHAKQVKDEPAGPGGREG